MVNEKTEKVLEIAPQSLHYVSSFHFNSSKPCYCHSGKRFGFCCGNSNANRQQPKHISIIPNYLSKTECQRFLRFAKKQKGSALKVVGTKQPTGNKSTNIFHRSRITNRVMLGRKQTLTNFWFKEACMNYLSPTVQARPEWIEVPHLLQYNPGGKYDIHSDAEHFDKNTGQFYRFIDRDFSMLIYLNDDYTGGELDFPWLNYQYKPVAGDLVFFPSNHVFTHQSLPIITGNKYALVSWGVLQGSPRVRSPTNKLPL